MSADTPSNVTSISDRPAISITRVDFNLEDDDILDIHRTSSPDVVGYEDGIEITTEEDAVLDVQRLLQAQLAVQLVHCGLRRALGQEHLGGIAGQDAEDQED